MCCIEHDDYGYPGLQTKEKASPDHAEKVPTSASKNEETKSFTEKEK